MWAIRERKGARRARLRDNAGSRDGGVEELATGNRPVLSSTKTLVTDSSEIAAVEPAAVKRRVLYTFTDVPLDAGRLVVSQVASTAHQKHQCRYHERGHRTRQATQVKKSPNCCAEDTREAAMAAFAKGWRRG